MVQVFGIHRSGILLLILSIFWGLCSASFSSAAEPDILVGIAKLMNLPEDSAEVQDFTHQIELKISSIRNGIHFPPSSKGSIPRSPSRHISKPEPTLEEKFNNVNVIKHFRRQDGIPFETWQPEAELSEHDKPSALKAWAHFDKGLKNAIEDLSNSKALPRCEKEISVKEVSPPELLKIIPKDMLFIRSKPLKDPDELFGQETALIYCTNEKGDGCSMSSRQIGITCLPTRFRVEGKNIVRYEGEGALKNYDSNKHGELHEVVRIRLREFLGR